MPEKNTSGMVYENRYIIGSDPVDNDQAESSSLSSNFVFDLYTDNIVAEYTGRQLFAEDNYEILRLLCIFYNARCLFESNIKGTYAYFRKMNCSHLLEDTPEYLRDKQLIKYNAFGSSQKGVNATAAINNYANSLLRDWLLGMVTVIKKNRDGEEEQVTRPRLYDIRSRGLLDELINYNPMVNVDRIRAMGMVMLYRESKIISYGKTGYNSNGDDKNYLGNDDYFKINYDLKFNITK